MGIYIIIITIIIITIIIILIYIYGNIIGYDIDNPSTLGVWDEIKIYEALII